jgi:uncharacterized protein YndB with AHSA1/START domain
MTGNVATGTRIVGTMRIENGTGVVRVEDRFDADINDLWSAVTDPARLAQWLCEVKGDLRVGGDVHVHFFGSGWEGMTRIEACEPPRRFQVSGQDEGLSYRTVKEVTLTPHGDQTILVVEDRGMPVDKLSGYGAGNHVEVELLEAYIAGREPADMGERWQALMPVYESRAAELAAGSRERR